MLESISTLFKESWIKGLSTTVVAIVGLFGAMWGITEHFATAADLNQVKNSVEIGQKVQSLDMQIQLNKQTTRELKGKIADIEDKPKLENTDKIKKERLQREIQEISRENELLMQQKFNIEIKK